MGHTYTSNLFHVIFSTKGRRPGIREHFRQRLYEYLAGVARQEFGKATAIGGTEDLIHGLLSLRSNVSIAEAMRKWKALSSKWVHETFPQECAFGWQSGYGSFTVSRSNVPEVISYIDGQAEHHRTVTFEEEFRAFLHRYGVEYDERYVWD